MISLQEIKNLQLPGICSYPEQLQDVQINEIQTGEWYPYGLTKVRDIYMSPFFNSFGSLNCIKIDIVYSASDMWPILYIGYNCNKDRKGEVLGNCFGFGLTISQDNQLQYGSGYKGCHPDLKMNVSIIGTDYKHFIVLFGCYENDPGHTNGVYVFVKSVTVPKTVEERIFGILNKVNIPVNDSSYFETLDSSNGTCDCSLECKYEICFGNYSLKHLFDENNGISYAKWVGKPEELQRLSETEIALIGVGLSFLLISNLVLVCLTSSFNVKFYLRH